MWIYVNVYGYVRRIYMNLHEFVWIERCVVILFEYMWIDVNLLFGLCGCLAVRQCAALRRCAAVCASVCGSAHALVSAQCTRHCAAVRVGAVFGSARGIVRLCGSAAVHAAVCGSAPYVCTHKVAHNIYWYAFTWGWEWAPYSSHIIIRTNRSIRVIKTN
jgi:hypothetical protein